MSLLDRLILAALGCFALYAGYQLIEVKSMLSHNPGQVIDLGLFVTAIGLSTIGLSLSRIRT